MVEEDELWQRLAAYDFDRADSELPFSVRLAGENYWTGNYARAVLEEYRRFAYLALRAGHPVTPSDEVDQAWHLHLLYSEEYWRRFCPEVLGRDLHHYPTEGGPAERAKFRAWYEATLASYRRLFGTEPPADIWPDADTRFRMAGGQRRRAVTRAWADRFDEWRDTVIAVVAAISTGWLGYMGVTSEVLREDRWIGVFMLVFAALATLAALFGHRLRRGKRRRGGNWRSSGGGDDSQTGDGGHHGDASGCGSGCGGGCGG